ncbi:hypothetical protein GSI_11899 [Ganoderma sinense ZZ0214-1]|uniref:F-box domain-containing protein n=1 Tax=Ganoderma sinense ZZ0214-1 TaxID=1077348 RepID=A0A2G8RXC7_9APHY|nr:hypothetical protein GSI_11899 [Ganoderma sinense ZZ0214-1]
MPPASQDDGGQSAGRSSFVRRVRTNPAWSSGLPEDVWYLVAGQLRPHDLAQFAAICRDTRYIADRFLHRSPTIRTARGVVSWAGALAARQKRRPLVRSLTIGWDGADTVEGDADKAYGEITRMLRGSHHLRSMTLFADGPEGRFATKRSLPHGVHTLNASAATFLNLHMPLPPLLHLSVNLHVRDLKRTLGAICSFGETLLQLRLFVKWETPFVKTKDNPARWCVLKTPRLVYFELREERSEKNVPLRITSGRWDKLSVTSNWPVVLAERVPSLRYLVWQPLWGERENDVLPGGAFYDVVREYRNNLFALLKLDVLAFTLADGRYSCHEAGKEDPRDGRPVAGPEDLWKSMEKPEGHREVQLL